jgi:plastocyanin
MRLRRLAALWGFLTLLGTIAPSAAATLTGALSQPSIVWISDGSAVPDTEVQVHNEDRQFIPETVVIRAGTSVRFPNDDPFFHSIYSSSPADPFDIGYYGFGPGKIVTFPRVGIIELHCHIHARMHGTIVVTDGPGPSRFVTQFRIDDVVPGSHELDYWNERTGLKSETVIVPASGGGTINLGTLR